MKPEDKVKLFYMANLYYMAGGNLPKKKYANGSMVMPNQMQPQMPMMQGPQADLSTTKQLTSIGLNPSIMGATGGLSAAIAPVAGLAIDAWKFNRAMDNSYDVNAMMGEAVKKQQRQASPYNTETGYMQGNFANGGKVPIWKMLGDDPFQFQMDENNNQQGGGESEAYKEGGLSRSKDYGSEKKPYPMVKGKDFAGGDRSYPIPTKADAVDALRLAGLHGRSDVKAKVYAKYPDLKKGHADGGPTAWNPNLAYSDSDFQNWYKNNTLEGKSAIPYSDKLDYDYYSYFKNTDKNQLSNPDNHFPDTYKRPNHNTFSNESIYSTPENKGGSWNGENYVPSIPDAITLRRAFNNGGPANDDYGTIPGNGNPTADDKNLLAEDGAFIVPANRVPLAQQMLMESGYDPYQELETMTPGAKQGGTPIRISSKEMYLSPDVKQDLQLDMGMTEHDWEKTLSPNSPHNRYYKGDYMSENKTSEWDSQGTNQYVNEQHNVMSKQKLSPTLFAMARFADGGGLGDWWYNNMRSQQYRDENYSPSEMKAMRKEEEAQLNDPDYSSEREINMRNNQQPTAETPETSTTTGLPEDFKKMNRNLLIANTVGAGGQALYNMMQKYTPMPRPQMYRPEKYTADFGALDEFMNRQIQKVGATSRYNARNVNQIPATNAAIQANQLENQIDRAAKMQQMQNELNYRNTELGNQANLLNLQNIQNVNLQDAENRFKFRAMKGQALSGNIESGLKGYRNYVNADFGMKALEQGYKAGQINEQLYRKALNTPNQLTPEEVKTINAITGGNFDPSKLVTPIQENGVIPGTI
jgi:hypothetical protein